jgi:hypothetical protein
MADQQVPEGLERHFRQSQLTDPWERAKDRTWDVAALQCGYGERLVLAEAAIRGSPCPTSLNEAGNLYDQRWCSESNLVIKTQPVKSLQQADVGGQRIGILHARIDDGAAGGGDAGRICGVEGKFRTRGMARNRLADLGSAIPGGIARRDQACRRARSLRRLDYEKTAIEAARYHARKIDLREIAVEAVTSAEIPARAGKAGRGIEMGVKREQPLVKLQCGPVDRRRGGNRRSGAEKQCSDNKSMISQDRLRL